MAKLEDLKRDAAARRVRVDCLVTVVDVKCYGSIAIRLRNGTKPDRPPAILGARQSDWRT